MIELLVSTVILAVAVAALLSAMSGSLRNLDRSSEYDRAAVAAKQKIEELLADRNLPRFRELTGALGRGMSWKARVLPYEPAPGIAFPGMAVFDRVTVEVSWPAGSARKSIELEGYRRGNLSEADARELALAR